MKLEISRGEFLRAWQLVSRYTPATTPDEHLKCIRVIADAESGVRLEATNLRSLVRYPVGKEHAAVVEGGAALLNASIVGNLLKHAGADRITLEVTGGRGLVRMGTNRTRIAVIPPERYPNLPESAEAGDIGEVLASDLARVVIDGCSAASAPKDFPKYLGTCLLRFRDGELTVVSTDSRRLAIAKTACTVQREMELVISANEMKELVKPFSGADVVQVKADSALVWFLLNGEEYALRQVETSYPRYERLLNDEVVVSMVLNTKEMLSVLERVAVIAEKKPLDKVMAMRLGEEMLLSSRVAGVGTVCEEFRPKEYLGPNLMVGCNVSYLMDGIKACGPDYVRMVFSGEESQIRLYRDGSEEFMYMLMPVRLESGDMNDEDMSDGEIVEGARD